MARPPRAPQRETELEELFDLSIDPMSIIGFDGEFKRVNASFLLLLGYAQPELFSRTALDILHPDDMEPARQALAQLADGHDVVGFEGRVVRADGSVRWVEWSTRSMPDRGVVYCVGRDTTERRRVDAELREAQRSLEASRDELAVLAEEQAALRRVATLVAGGVPSGELFGAVAREVGTLFRADFAGMIRYEGDESVTTVASWAAGGDHPLVPSRWEMVPGDPATIIAETRRPARVDVWARMPGAMAAVIRDELDVSSSVGCPIVVEGRLWGALAIHSKQRAPWPPDTESRIAQFTNLVATAIGNTESGGRADRLAQEQAGLRRVATLVAQGAPSDALFSAVCAEVEALAEADVSVVVRFEADGTVTVMGTASARHSLGGRLELDPDYVVAEVHRTGRAARFDTDDPAAAGMPEVVRAERVRSALASPIVVDGELWGAITTGSRDRPLAAGMERRLADFTELVATAIANAETRAEVERLAAEQAALRRVATVVAGGVSRAQVFTAIAEEVQKLFGTDLFEMFRYEDDRSAVAVASTGVGTDVFPVGSRHELGGENGPTLVFRTGGPGRIDDYTMASGPIAETVRGTGLRSVVATPLVVDDRLWGVMVIGTTRDQPLPSDTESRLGKFTELMATAIANTGSRAEVERLAEEQAALRRVATQVAEGAPPTAVFDAVAAEMEGLLGADRVSVSRYEPGAEIVVLAHRGSRAQLVPTGSRLSLEGKSLQEIVFRTEWPARMDNFDEAHGPIADVQRTMGVRGAVAVPVFVDGRVWGVIGASWVGEEPPPVDTEDRMAQFAGLLETAIANADSRGQLDASRARLVTEADEARRRLVRDLHDGAQQGLMHTIVMLKLAEQALGTHDSEARQLVGDALERAEQSNRELRELAHGILPAVLERGGLRAGVDAFVERLELSVGADVPAERFPAEIEASAYFIVAEALTNVVKHAHAKHAEVTVSVRNRVLHLQVRDDGIGGANRDGHGLVGLGDRATALGGRLQTESPAGGGTLLTATLPLPTD